VRDGLLGGQIRCLAEIWALVKSVKGGNKYSVLYACEVGCEEMEELLRFCRTLKIEVVNPSRAIPGGSGRKAGRC
jgi:hypothetical protein